ncbi:hypothetical protein HFRIS_015791 [Herbaspirillum frisingense GSF30]|jgi:hypothetical protein|uniref:Lipoprotein n=1 Tax=Herbaspirillum frisingense GSF30 TaxID=864073 RepID=A0AAI9N354_9BURK|nr:hypothetical protein [Herbaspirillum frisingense]EOA03834.1 hypothetical protein HFRIS_015791 [Herbaspirillum frisingense GSF30]
MTTDKIIASMNHVVVLAIIFTLAGCGPSDERIVGPYLLTHIDTQQDMYLCYELPEGNCVGRIQKTVFAVGWDDRYIVAKRHPDSDRKVVQYFFLEMAKDSHYADPSTSVTGPMSEESFSRYARLLGLPPFTKTITQLE